MGSTKMVILLALVVLISLVKDIQSCYCPPMPDRDSFCYAPFAIKGYVEYNDVPLDSLVPRGMYTRYTVRIEEVFRNQGDENIKEGQDLTISVPFGSSMCGMILTEGRHYFMTGFIHQHGHRKYQVNGCDWTQFYDTMTPEQLNGISGGFDCSST